MGLLELFNQNGSLLDIETPSVNGGPINDPASNFVQNYLPDNTYLSNVEGFPNNGSSLYNPPNNIDTLNNTALDNTSTFSTTGLTPPFNDVISAPQNPYTTGPFGVGYNNFITVWFPSQGYLTVVNVNSTTMENTLFSTSLDVENPDYYNPGAPPPNNISAPTDYGNTPSQAQLGEFGGAPSQYNTPYGPNNTYLDNFNNNTQVNTLDETGLDIEDSDSAPTTFTPNNISAPTDYGNVPPIAQLGEFGGAPFQYITPWGPNNTYGATISTIVNPSNNPQANSLNLTGLDIENPDSAPTAFTPNDISVPTDYGNTPPQAQMGEFGGAASQYDTPYSPNNTYLNTFDPNIQINTLDETGLDIEDSNSAPTAFVPDSTSVPTDYSNTPSQAQMGEFGGAPSQYSTPYGPNNTYLDTFDSNIQTNTLGETGLDIEDSNSAPTAFVPDSTSAPTDYGNTPSQAQMGEFGGAPSQYTTLYNSNNTYLDTFNNDTQVNTLDYTGLDISNSEFNSTTIPPNNTSAPTDYGNVPPIAQLGEFGGAPSQYTTQYAPDNPYSNLIPVIVNPADNPQVNTLDETGLDIEDSTSAPTVTPPNNISAPTDYSNTPPQAYMGEFNGAPSQYVTLYNPGNTYLNTLNPNIQVNTLEETGLNIGDNLSAPTSFIPGDPTVYPYINDVNLGEFNGPPSFFAQPYTSNKYYLFPSNLSKLINPDTNPQIKTLNGEINAAFPLSSTSETSLDTRVTTDSVTIYPGSYVTGTTGSAPQLFNQRWIPDAYVNTYYGYMKENGFAAAVA